MGLDCNRYFAVADTGVVLLYTRLWNVEAVADLKLAYSTRTPASGAVQTPSSMIVSTPAADNETAEWW
jgi:hypothetical protein